MLRVVMLRLAMSQLRSAAAAAAADSSAVFEIIVRWSFQIKHNTIIKHESMHTETNDARSADFWCAVSRSDSNSNASQQMFKQISDLDISAIGIGAFADVHFFCVPLRPVFFSIFSLGSLDPLIKRDPLKQLWRQHCHKFPPPRPQHSKRHR